MIFSPRPRRFRRNATHRAHTLGYLTTATVMTRNGIPAAVAERYSAQVTKTAARLGAASTAITYSKRNGKARATRAYNLATTGLGLLLALVTYRPAAPRRLRNGQLSRAKAEQVKAARLAAYTQAIGPLALVTAA